MGWWPAAGVKLRAPDQRLTGNQTGGYAARAGAGARPASEPPSLEEQSRQSTEPPGSEMKARKGAPTARGNARDIPDLRIRKGRGPRRIARALPVQERIGYLALGARTGQGCESSRFEPESMAAAAAAAGRNQEDRLASIAKLSCFHI